MKIDCLHNQKQQGQELSDAFIPWRSHRGGDFQREIGLVLIFPGYIKPVFPSFADTQYLRDGAGLIES